MRVGSSLKIHSSVIKEGERIPERYTCFGENISPPISWSKPEAGVKSWVLILEDPDAPRGTFTHWVLFNIPDSENSLPEALPATGRLQNGALQGINDSMKLGYTGPCPPSGPVHHYHFILYALDKMLNLLDGATKKQVRETMQGHIISQAEMVAIYQS